MVPGPCDITLGLGEEELLLGSACRPKLPERAFFLTACSGGALPLHLIQIGFEGLIQIHLRGFSALPMKELEGFFTEGLLAPPFELCFILSRQGTWPF